MTAQGGDLLAWLDAAITRREQAASAAPKGPWRFVPSGRGPASPPGYEDQKILGADREVAGPGYEGGGVFGEAAGMHIVLNDPASVLRRCAADRKLIAAHPITRDVITVHPDGTHGFGCSVCHTEDLLTVGDGWCDSLRALAEGYGWTEGER